jgi:hypothetical protein
MRVFEGYISDTDLNEYHGGVIVMDLRVYEKPLFSNERKYKVSIEEIETPATAG